MAYVTEDERVRELVSRVRRGLMTEDTAARQIGAMGFLDWEVNEARAEMRRG